MTEANPYSKIIYKGREDVANADLVNPYLHRSTSRNKYTRWSPEINRQEVLKKKLDRENEYVKRLESEDKPVLMIQQKKVYQQLKDPQFISPESNDFFKVTSNTKVIDSIDVHLETARQDRHRPTQVMLSKAPGDQDIYTKGVVKIEGLEYLPEGFLELDPILLMDDYEFETFLDRQKFSEEQRRLKALRRKQYQERDKARNRQVTIFVVNEYKDRLMEYFEEWYAQNRRKMTKEELEYIANILQSDYATIAKLQDLFLQRKKVINSNHLHKFQVRNRNVKGLESDEAPNELKKLFLTSPTDGYLKTDSKLIPQSSSYTPTYITKYQEKYGRRQKKGNQLSKSTQKLKSARTQQIDPSTDDLSKFTKDFEQLLGQSAKPASVQATGTVQGNQTGKTGVSIFKTNTDEDLRVYFDEEINQILDKIRACKGNEVSDKSQPPKNNQVYVDMHKQRLQNLVSQLNEEERQEKAKSTAKPEVDVSQPIFEEGRVSSVVAKLSAGVKVSGAVTPKKSSAKNDARASSPSQQKAEGQEEVQGTLDESKMSVNRKKTTLDQIRMESMLLKYNMNPEEFRPKADMALNQNWMIFDIRPPNLSIPNFELLAGPTRKTIIENHRVSTASPNEDVLMTYPVSEFIPLEEFHENEEGKEPPKSSTSINRSGSPSLQPQKKTTIIRPSDAGPFLRPHRVTVISKHKKHFETVTQKFKPHLGKVDFFFEVISDGLPVNGKMQAILMTLNVNQELILIDELSEDTADKMYQDFMTGVYDSNTYLVVLRDRNQEVVEIYVLNFANELTDDQVRHMLSLITEEPLKKTTLLQEFWVSADQARKASSISQSKLSKLSRGFSPSRGKAKSEVQPKLSGKGSEAKRLTSKPDQPDELQEMEEKLDHIHEDADEEVENKLSQEKDDSKVSFGKKSKADEEGIVSRSVGTGSFSQMPAEDQPPKESVISTNQLVRRSIPTDQKGPTALTRNEGQSVNRLTFQDASVADSNTQDDAQRDGKRTSFVEIKNNLAERQSLSGGRGSSNNGRSNSQVKEQIHVFQEEAEANQDDSNLDASEQLKPRSSRHEEAFNDLLKQYNEERRESEARTSQLSENKPSKLSVKEADQIRQSIQKMLDGARTSGQGGGLMEAFEEEMRKGQADGSLIDQFYQFCREKLPSDQKYKESVLFVSLFYYFLEKKQMIKE